MLPVLGIMMDTVRGEFRLPQEKIDRLLALLADWQVQRSCTKKELESLIGLLNHACKVVRSGRPFLRRMSNLPTIQYSPDQAESGL